MQHQQITKQLLLHLLLIQSLMHLVLVISWIIGTGQYADMTKMANMYELVGDELTSVTLV